MRDVYIPEGATYDLSSLYPDEGPAWFRRDEPGSSPRNRQAGRCGGGPDEALLLRQPRSGGIGWRGRRTEQQGRRAQAQHGSLIGRAACASVAFATVCAGVPALVILMIAVLTAIDPSRVPQ